MKNAIRPLLLLAMLLPAAAFGQSLVEDDDYYYVRLPKHPLRIYREFTPQHEVRLSASAYPVMSSSGYYDHYYNRVNNLLVYDAPIYATGVWTFSYDYRIKKWFDAGFAVSYYGEFGATYSNVDNTLISRMRRNRIAVMPAVRFTWLNRTWVRLYSSLGMGVLIDTERRTANGSYAAFAGQFTPIGITVGKALFGFAEVGVGTNGALTVGIGYRFNDKNRKR